MWEYENNRGFKGAVLDTGEHNFYDDSDFYAVVWDEDTQSVHRIGDGTTRCHAPACCHVDATPEVVAKAEKWLAEVYWPPQVRESLELRNAAVKPGRVVRVTKGRKVPVGFTGLCVDVRDGQWGKSVRIAPLGGTGMVSINGQVKTGVKDWQEWVWTSLNNVVVDKPEPVDEEEVRRLSENGRNHFRGVGQTLRTLI